MNFTKRAFLSITRRKGRALILFLVVFVLGNLIAGAISVQQATTNVEKRIKNQLGGKATIETNYKEIEKAYTNGEELNIETLTEDTIKKIGSSNYVKYYDYNLEIYGGGKDVKSYQPENNSTTMIQAGTSEMDFKLRGVQYNKILDLEEKKSKLLDGRTFTEEEIEKGSNVGLISKKVADENGLSIGDNFVFQTNVVDYSNGNVEDIAQIASRDVSIEIIGIFEPIISEKKDSEGNKQSDPMQAFNNTQFQNTVYVPNEVALKETKYQQEELKKAGSEISDELPYTPYYVLKNPEVVDSFKEENKSLIPKTYTLNTSADQYNSISAPIKSMSKLSGYILIAAVGAALLIVSLVILLFLRDRKHEFGVYLSLGERRQRVLGQIVIEVLVMAFLAISLSVFSGNYLAKGISNSMIQSQIQADIEKEESQSSGSVSMIVTGDNTLDTSLSTEDVTKEYTVNLTPTYIISFFIVGLVTVILATIAPMIYLLRLNPKKIMM